MSASFNDSGAWIPLMDYAVKKGVSLSTLRRYIKADKIKHRIESGRYLIWDEDSTDSLLAQDHFEPNESVQDLELRLRKSQEEITELKMLVALYEEQLFRRRPAAEPR